MEAQTIEPAVGIAEGFEDCRPAEMFLTYGVAIGCESGMDELPFGIVEELSSVRVVLDEPVGSEGDNNSDNSFLQ